MTHKREASVGKAYAFFDCDASSKEDIERAMPNMRSAAKVPKDLQLIVHEGSSGLQLDEGLIEQLQYPDDYRVMSSKRREQGYEEERRPLDSMKYVIEADYEGASNEHTADHLRNVVNYAHRKFDEDQNLFRCATIYEKDGTYHVREEK